MVTQNILEIAIRHAEEAGANQISSIHLQIGQLATLVDDSIQFYWDIISKGTIAQGAQLNFLRIPAQFQCNNCKEIYSLNGDDFSCPSCHGIDIQIIAGREFALDSIEIE